MKQVTFENIQPGMIVAKDVHDRNGRLILKTGTSIQDNHLRIFKLWRITSIFIEGENSDDDENVSESVIDPVLQKKLDIKFKQLFRNVDSGDSFTKQLYRYSFQRAGRSKKSGGLRVS